MAPSNVASSSEQILSDVAIISS